MVPLQKSTLPTVTQVRVELRGGPRRSRALPGGLCVLSGGRPVALQLGETALQEAQKQGLGTDALFPRATERHSVREQNGRLLSPSKAHSCLQRPPPDTRGTGKTRPAGRREAGGDECCTRWQLNTQPRGGRWATPEPVSPLCSEASSTVLDPLTPPGWKKDLTLKCLQKHCAKYVTET